jgi:hypothetical protein
MLDGQKKSRTEAAFSGGNYYVYLKTDSAAQGCAQSSTFQYALHLFAYWGSGSHAVSSSFWFMGLPGCMQLLHGAEM